MLLLDSEGRRLRRKIGFLREWRPEIAPEHDNDICTEAVGDRTIDVDDGDGPCAIVRVI